LKTFFNIALSGLSEADAKQVIAALDSPKLGSWSLAEGGNSDLVIIDVDSVWGHMDWLRAVADDRICVAYTEQESMRDCKLLLRKPLSTDTLVEMLVGVQAGKIAPSAPGEKASRPAAKAKPAPAPKVVAPRAQPAPVAAPTPAKAETVAETASKPAAATPPANATPAPPKAAPEPEPIPTASEPQTVGALLLDGGVSDTVIIHGPGNARLVIDPTTSSYHAAPQLKPLQKLLDTPVKLMRSVASDDPEVRHAGPQQPIIRLLWFAALCASEGKLAPHLDPGATWRLTRWPQIEREFPRHFRIATAMMKQAGTLEEVATAAKSPVEDVAGFINAYYVAGYVAPEGAEESTEATSSAPRVLARLRRSFSKSAQASS
jgi:hypothetical protein